MSDSANTTPTSPESNVEKDTSNIAWIALFGAGFVVVVGAIIVGVWQFATYTLRQEVVQKQEQIDFTELRDLRSMEQQKLSRYQWINKAEDRLRVPTDRAKELVIADYSAKLEANSPALVAPAVAVSAAPSGSASR
jgi:nitrate reductase beta subunit